MTLPRRMLLLLMALLMALLLMAGPALADPGVNRGIGNQSGGGNAVNPDNGNHYAKGGGTLNNPHLAF